MDAYQRTGEPLLPIAEAETNDEPKVAVSSECRELAPAKTEPAQLKPSKVETLRAAIAAGTFEIDPDVVAAALVDELLTRV